MLVGHLRRPRPRRQAPLVRAVRALWTLPTNLLGHLAGWMASGGRLPRRVGGPAAVGWLYPIRPGLGLDWVGAVTIGHAILHRPGVVDGPTPAARLTLAHELAHTRQHDLLGPLYLPLHILAQAASALLTRGRPITVSRVHDLNPLEQTFIAVPSSAPYAPGESDDDVADVLAAFGA
ncbi:MAG TPA: DUF4157 domain-containing protein [Polyangia bacterium]|nr:DUF4157 domain-containing protein [Polyangia bacterium]